MTAQTHQTIESFLDYVTRRNAGEPEFLQAVTEVVQSLWPFLERNPRYMRHALLERLVEAERLVRFRVCWSDDAGRVHVNRGWRVQHSMAIGAYKGGLRFHPSVTASVLKFLAFEQTLKNALTGLPMGGAKGGSDFDPKGKSNAEVMRFCQAFASELFRHVGAGTDIPAGDIGVGEREIGFIAGMHKKITNSASCTFTGKGLSYGGSLMRPEATGYGLAYFAQEMLATRGRDLEGLRVSISGAGNVAQYAVQKTMQLGAKVVSVSDSGGTVYDAEGFTPEKLALLMEMKNERQARLSAYALEAGLEFLPERTPWHIPVDVALPCATQNELHEEDAQRLIANGVICVAEGANMPSTLAATEAFESAGVLFGPGKASNAGGVATSGLEISQNALGMPWSSAKVEARLKSIMQNIHRACLEHGQDSEGRMSYVRGANIAGFVKVADAMLAQGVV